MRPANKGRRGPLLSDRGRQWLAVLLTAAAALAMAFIFGTHP